MQRRVSKRVGSAFLGLVGFSLLALTLAAAHCGGPATGTTTLTSAPQCVSDCEYGELTCKTACWPNSDEARNTCELRCNEREARCAAACP